MTEKQKKELICKALEARKNSYSPYSGFRVGAALLCADGEVITGFNIENAAYSATVCAERTAIFKAVSMGKRAFTAIAVAGGKGEEPDDYSAPCGVCRQVMREFCDPKNFKVILAIRPDRCREYTLEQLLPLSFGPESFYSCASEQEPETE